MNFLSRWLSRFALPPAHPAVDGQQVPGIRIEPPIDANDTQDHAGLHFGGLDLAGLLDCHGEWLRRLGRSLDEKHEDLPVHLDNIIDDRNCALGRWLDSDIRERYGHTPEFQALDRRHHEFHRLAADICRCHNQGLHEVARWGLLRDLKQRSEQLRQDLEQFYLHHLS